MGGESGEQVMIQAIRENLNRQNKATALLHTLLQEEFAYLRKGDPQPVSGLEMSIQELMRQIASERFALKGLVAEAAGGEMKLMDFAGSLEGGERADVAEILALIDESEQECAKQADKNYHLALALHDQSRSMLSFIQEKVTPRHGDTYARNGRYSSARSGAALVTGRL